MTRTYSFCGGGKNDNWLDVSHFRNSGLGLILYSTFIEGMEFTMHSYGEGFVWCQHINVNGKPCGSPALPYEKFCYFHLHWRLQDREVYSETKALLGAVGTRRTFYRSSVERGIAEVSRLLATRQIDSRVAAMMLDALQRALSFSRSRLLGGTQEDFAGEGLGSLGDDHADSVSYV